MSGTISHIEKQSLLAQIRALPTQGHVGSVTTVTVTEDGLYLFTTGDDNSAKRWLVPTGQVVNHYLGHTDSVWCLGATSCGAFIITGSRDALAKRWDVESGECLMDYAGHEGEDPGVRCLSIVPGDATFFTGSRDFTMRHWSVESGACLGVIRGHAGIIWNTCVSPDGRWLLSASADNLVKVWAIGGASGTSVDYDAPAAKALDHGDFVWSVTVSPDSRKVFTGCRDHKARRWDLASGACELEFEGHTDTVRWVALDKSGTRLLTAGYDVLVKEWDAASGQLLQNISAHGKAVLCVTASPTDSNIFSGSADALVMRFNPAPHQTPEGAADVGELLAPVDGAASPSPESDGPAPSSASFAGLGSPAKQRVLLVEAPLTTFTHIPRLKIWLIVLALVVQTLQLAGFAFSIRFPWPVSVEWLRVVLSGLSLSLDALLSWLPTFPIGALELGVVGWTYICCALFYGDAFGLLQRLKAHLNAIGWGRVKRSRYKGDNPLEVGDRTATNKAEWEVWETTTWVFWTAHQLSRVLWGFLWLASTLFAIPTISILAGMLFDLPKDSGKFWVALVGLLLYIVLFLRLRIVNGSASAVSFARKEYAAKNRGRLIPGAWLFTVGGIAALDTLGPFTMADWNTELGTASVQIGFSVVNSSSVRIMVVATLNLFFAFLLVANLIKNDAFYSLKSSRALFGLQAVQVWNSSIAIAVVLLNDSANVAPSIVWYCGVIPMFFIASGSYTLIHNAKQRKRLLARAEALALKAGAGPALSSKEAPV